VISVHHAEDGMVGGELAKFRQEFYRSLPRRADALFELADAVLCADGPMRSLPELSLVGEHRRGHGSGYAGLVSGRLDVDRLRRALTAGPLPRAADGRLVLAVDITCWLRPEAHTSPERILCHTYGRGKDTHIMVPGWPYSVIAALETGRSSWTAPLDAVRLAPGDDAATVTARQVRQVVALLLEAGHWSPGDAEILLVADAGYDGPRLAFLLSDLPVGVLVRMRSDRVLRRPTPVHLPGTMGRPRRHGDEFVFGDSATWGEPDVTTRTDTRLYGPALVRARDRLHPRLTHRTAWATHLGKLPIIEGTVIRLEVDRLPSGAIPKPVWLWHSATDLDATDVDLLWQAFLRRFDIEHTFRMLKQTLGWTTPKLPHTRTGRSLDLADPGRLHPTPPRPPSHHRPTPPLGENRPPWPTDPGSGPPRVSAPPHNNRHTSQRTETHPTRPRTTNRTPQPTTSPTPRRPHRHQHKPTKTEHQQDNQVQHPTTPPNRLKLKLSDVS
jgi:hypothetical protein